MALGKDRSRIHVRGLGNMEIMLKEPTVDTEASNVGLLKSVDLSFIPNMEEIVGDNGDLQDWLMRSIKHTMTFNLSQSSKDEFDLVMNAGGKVYGARYAGLVSESGRFQYFSADALKLAPGVNAAFQPGHRVLPVNGMALKPDNTFSTPPVYVVESLAELRTQNLHLFVATRNGHISGTVNLLDLSGWGRHGVISSAYATIWQSAGGLTFIRLDGANDSVNFGNVCNIGATDDFVIEAWVRVQGANATLQRIASKKSTTASGTAGWMLQRSTGNVLQLLVSNGTTQYTISNTTTSLQNVWRHALIAVPKGGNAQAYLNGAADGSTVAIASSNDQTNSVNLYLGQDASANKGQVDIQGLRVYNFGLAGMPTDIATIAANHYAGEKGYHGL